MLAYVAYTYHSFSYHQERQATSAWLHMDRYNVLACKLINDYN